MIEITKIIGSDVFLGRVKKDYYNKGVLITVGYVVKIGDTIQFKSAIQTTSGRINVLNFFDRIKVNKFMEDILKEVIK